MAADPAGAATETAEADATDPVPGPGGATDRGPGPNGRMVAAPAAVGAPTASGPVRSRRLLTARGRAVLAVTAALAVPAGLLGSQELTTLVGCGLVAVALAVLWVVRRPRLEVRREIHPHRVTRGVEALGRVTVANRSLLPSAPAVGIDPCGGTVAEIALPRLAAGRERARTYRLPTDRRGRFTVGPLRIARVDPLGLAARVQEQGSTETLWVHPVQHPVRSVGGGRVRRLDGPEIDRLPHGTITFHALREYVRGDDLRHIHWRTSARIGELMVREHIDVSVPVITLLVDNRASVHTADSFEDALEVVASLAVAAARERYACVVHAVSGQTAGGPATAGDARVALDLLAGLHLTGDPAGAVVASLTRAPARDTLVAATGSPTDHDLAPLVGLRRQYPRLVVVGLGGGAPAAAGPGVEVIAAADGAEAIAAWNARVRR